jgi:hypothetical protein
MVRIKEVAGDTRVTYPSPLVRRRRPKAAGPLEPGFVLILVLPVAMLLLMTALSLVSRSNSAAVASSRESAAQAARMAAEHGLNELMARINVYDCDNPLPLDTVNTNILGSSPPASYTIIIDPPISLCSSPPQVQPCTINPITDLPVEIHGKLTDNTGTTYNQVIKRTISICDSAVLPKPYRVRAVKPRLIP